MNTAIVTVKVDRETKQSAQVVAKNLGFSLSAVINAYLKELVRTKTLHVSLSEEEPTEYFLNAIKESKKDIKAGRVISFKNFDEEMAYLDKIIAEKKKAHENNLFKTI